MGSAARTVAEHMWRPARFGFLEGWGFSSLHRDQLPAYASHGLQSSFLTVQTRCAHHRRQRKERIKGAEVFLGEDEPVGSKDGMAGMVEEGVLVASTEGTERIEEGGTGGPSTWSLGVASQTLFACLVSSPRSQ